MLEIIRAESKREITIVEELFEEYAASLDFNLCFQNFDRELAELPGEYASPSGVMLLAKVDGTVAGCVALRSIGEEICEMKRLYVKPQYRGSGIGRKLAEAVIRHAVEIGYKTMRLDTIPSMIEATSLYRSLGFQSIEPYRPNPIEGAIYLELKLK